MKTSTSGTKSRKTATPRRRNAAAGAAAVRGTVKQDEGSVASNVSSTILRSGRKNIETLAQAGHKSYQGIEAVVLRRRDILRETLSELKAVAKVMRSAGARESIAHLDDLGRGAISLTLASIRELAKLAAATQNEAFKLLEQRLREDIADLKRLRHTKPARRDKTTD